LLIAPIVGVTAIEPSAATSKPSGVLDADNTTDAGAWTQSSTTRTISFAPDASQTVVKGGRPLVLVTVEPHERIAEPELNVSVSGDGVSVAHISSSSGDYDHTGIESDCRNGCTINSSDAFAADTQHTALARLAIDSTTTADSVTLTVTPEGGTPREVTYDVRSGDGVDSSDQLAEAARARARLARSHVDMYEQILYTEPVEETIARNLRRQYAIAAKSVATSVVVGYADEVVSGVKVLYDAQKAYRVSQGGRTSIGKMSGIAFEMAENLFEVRIPRDRAKMRGNSSYALVELERLAEAEARAWEDGNRTKARLLLLKQRFALINRQSNAISTYTTNHGFAEDYDGGAGGAHLTLNAGEQRSAFDSGTDSYRFFSGLRDFGRATADRITDVLLPLAGEPRPSVRLNTSQSRVRSALTELDVGETTNVTFNVSNGDGAGPTSHSGYLSFSHSRNLNVTAVEQVKGDEDVSVARHDLGETIIGIDGTKRTAVHPLVDVYEQYDSGERNVYRIRINRTEATGTPWIAYRTAFNPLINTSAGGMYFVRYPTSEDVASTDQQGAPVFNVSAERDHPPVARMDVSNSTVTGETRITFDAGNSTDPDDDIASYEWDLDGDGSFETSGERVTETYLTPGTHDVTLQVTDDDGNSDTANTTITVLRPSLPPVARINVSETTVRAYTDVTFDAGGSTDPNADIVRYEWDLNDDGKFGDPTIGESGEQVTTDYSTPGTYNVTLRVVDDDGHSDTANKTITVVRPLALEDLSVNRSDVFLGGSVRVDATIVNEGTEAIDYSLYPRFNGSYVHADSESNTSVELDPGESVRARFNFTFDSPTRVSVSVTDHFGNVKTSGASVTVQVKARPDTYVRRVGGSDYVTLGETVTFSLANSSDPDGTVTAYRWDIDRDGTVEHKGPTYTRTFREPGVFSYQVRVVDDSGYATSMDRAVFVRRPTDWPSAGIGPSRTGWNPRVSGPTDGVGRAWTVDTNSTTRWETIKGGPVIVNGTAYVVVDYYSTRLNAYNATTGALEWSTKTGVSGPPVVWGETVLLANYRLGGVAVDRETGGIRWRVSDAGGSPAVFGGVAYFPSGTAVNVTTGETVWEQYFAVNREYDGVAVSDGTVYYSGGPLAAVDAINGSVIWKRDHVNYTSESGGTASKIDLYAIAPPAVADDTVFTGDRYLSAIDARTGSTRWIRDLGANTTLEASPAVANGTVYVSTKNDSDSTGGWLYALDVATGTIEWRAEYPDWGQSPPVVADGVVYVASDDCERSCAEFEYTYPEGHVWAFDAETGRMLWDRTTDDSIRTAPAAWNGRLYVGAGENLVAFTDDVNVSPLADASNLSAAEGTPVELNATASRDPDGDALTFSWRQTRGPDVTLEDADTATPEFTAPGVDRERTLAFELIVSDGHGHTDGENVTVTVRDTGSENETTTCVADAVAGNDGTIGLTDIQGAIDWWAEGADVPDTGGETISLARIQSLIDAWAEGATVSCPA
jgi:outer membrane protein assembly factor BamB